MALPPGPRTSPFGQTLRLVRGPMEFLDECHRRYGDTFTLRVWSPGRTAPVVFTSDPGTIKRIFTTSDDSLRAGEAAVGVVGPFLGDYSLLTLDGPEHRRQRKLLMPPFHGERMRAYGDTMRNITEASIEGWPVGTPFELHDQMQQITLNVILRTVFGLQDGSHMDRLGAALTAVMDLGRNPLNLLPLSRVNWGPRSPRGTFERLKNNADKLVFEEITRRRGAGGHEDRTDVLALMLSAVDEAGEGMGDQEIRDELVTMLAAGHETTATALAWTVDRLLSRHSTYERLVAEIDDVLRGDPITADHIPKLEYLDAVCKESLRLRPVVPNVARVAQVPLTVRGFALPARTVIAPSIYLTHRRADLYPEPHKFKPERWLGAKVDPYKWLPFGGGTRRCIGMAFAMFELKVVLATTLRRVSLGLAPGSTGRMARRTVTFAPSDGALVVANPRLAQRRRELAG